jgi:hypothetical protein
MRALQQLMELSALQARTQARRAQGHCRLQQGLGFEKALECLSVCETKATGAAAAAAAADDRDPCLKVVTESESEEEEEQQQQEEEDGDDVQCLGGVCFLGGNFVE